MPHFWQHNTLVLTPTELERKLLRQLLPTVQDIELCGFGPIAAATETTRLISLGQPSSVLLLGIAGTYDSDALPLATACSFQSVACWGVGVGEGPQLITPRELGFAQIEELEVFDECALEVPASVPAKPQLLTVCSASSNSDDVIARRNKFPQAVAEDMEAFSVALACRRAGLKVAVIRGISNIAGDRQPDKWFIPQALEKVAELVAGLFNAKTID